MEIRYGAGSLNPPPVPRGSVPAGTGRVCRLMLISGRHLSRLLPAGSDGAWSQGVGGIEGAEVGGGGCKLDTTSHLCPLHIRISTLVCDWLRMSKVALVVVGGER